MRNCTMRNVKNFIIIHSSFIILQSQKSNNRRRNHKMSQTHPGDTPTLKFNFLLNSTISDDCRLFIRQENNFLSFASFCFFPKLLAQIELIKQIANKLSDCLLIQWKVISLLADRVLALWDFCTDLWVKLWTFSFAIRSSEYEALLMIL